MVNKSKKILSEISAGELLDKISILEIKLEKVEDTESLTEIKKEYEILTEVKNLNIEKNEKLKPLLIELKKINQNLWDIEDKLRIFEKNKDFGEAFVKLARDVYFNNDKRASIKSEINKTLGSNIFSMR